jgi:hypothetical protein
MSAKINGNVISEPMCDLQAPCLAETMKSTILRCEPGPCTAEKSLI